MAVDFKYQCDPYLIREITLQDWAEYKNHFEQMPAPKQWGGYFKEHDINAPSMPDKFFRDIQQSNQYRLKLFGLFNDQAMIGQTMIRFPNPHSKPLAVFGGTQILPDYRGQHLVDNFYKARFAFLEEIGFEGGLTLHVDPKTTASSNAALRHNFIKTDETLDFGHDVYYSKFPIQAQPNPPASP